ncbi:hypothetical protein CBR_g12516 [Chara braunii]|uniref:Uncharacterized protein n=1 Tax=Chara braunii TaxID=69332 RepID=A0A388JSJ1_CHABU|nr:hypothetical protein CBR_g12516 [Chara braunii]|eukprot:GBG60778.1 hypothetical protein CBR_g12516 [Chara braunii]
MSQSSKSCVIDQTVRWGLNVSPVDVPSMETPTLGFRRDGVSRECYIGLTALSVPRIAHVGGSGSVRSQGIVINDSAPQRVVTATTTIVSAMEHVDKGPVHMGQTRHWEPSNAIAVGGSSRNVIQLSHAGGATIHDITSTGGERREEGTSRHKEAGRKGERGDQTLRPDDNDGEPLSSRKKRTRQEELEAKSKLWTDGKTFLGSGLGLFITDIVHICTDYYYTIVNGNAGATAPHGLIMPTPDVPCLRIDDPAQQEPTLHQARKTENVAMRVIHRWIFRSSSRYDGFARPESYVVVDYPTDLARAVWQSVEWSG